MKYLFIIILFLAACEKAEDINPVTPADSTVKVQYVIETEHGYTWYNIQDTEFYHPIHVIFDTTFYVNPGWEAKIHALTTTGSMRVSLLVNDKIIASEQNYTGQNITIIREI